MSIYILCALTIVVGLSIQARLPGLDAVQMDEIFIEPVETTTPLHPIHKHIQRAIKEHIAKGHQPFEIRPITPHLDTPHCQEASYKGGCCLSDVDLHSLGLKEVSYPGAYITHTCSGSCPARNPLSDGNVGTETSECVPYSYTSLIIDYKDATGTNRTTLVPDVNVRSCYCK